MARVQIVPSLVDEIKKTFSKHEAHEILDLMQSCEQQPKKGKLLGMVGGIAIKELKYKKYRFYFLTDGFTLKMMNEKALADLLLRFVRMSDKKHQQQTIEQIRTILQKIGPSGFS